MKTIIPILLTLLVLGCSKDTTDNPVTPDNNRLLKQITKSGIINAAYEYFPDDKIKERKYYDDDGNLNLKHVFEFNTDTSYMRTYNATDELIRTRRYYDLTDDTSRRDLLNTDNELVSYRIYHFNDANCDGFSAIDFFDANDVMTSSNTFEFTDDNCSTTSTIFNSSSEITETTERTRDDKNHCLKSTQIDFFRGKEFGNTQSYKIWDASNVLDVDASFESTFEYNTDNFPTTETRTYFNEDVFEYVYEYY